jgi:hypothetical protein
MAKARARAALRRMASLWADHHDPYPKMAPLDQYLMEHNAEIALARSAAPDSISHDADIFLLGQHGYESAVKGKNGFVCLVMRSWTAGPEDPNFWNPKLRGPACFNAAATRSFVPSVVFKRTELILAGVSKERMLDAVKAGYDKKDWPALEVGSMGYMMSPSAYLSDTGGRWHPHLMFFLPETSDLAWGGGLPGSPVVVAQDPTDHLTVFMIPLDQWSDGTPEPSNNSESDAHKH